MHVTEINKLCTVLIELSVYREKTNQYVSLVSKYIEKKNLEIGIGQSQLENIEIMFNSFSDIIMKL